MPADAERLVRLEDLAHGAALVVGALALLPLAQGGAQALEPLLLLVHEPVGPPENIVQAGVGAGDVFRHAGGDHHQLPCDMVLAAETQGLHELRAGLVIPAREEGHKLVAAGAVDGTVLEDLADQTAGGADVLVAGLVPEIVVDVFQLVDITDHKGELPAGAAGDIRVEYLLLHDVSVLALDAGQRVGADKGLALAGALIQVGVVGKHDGDGEREHPRGHEDGPGIAGLQLGHLLGDEELVRHALAVGRAGGVVGLDMRQHLVVGGDHGLAHPDQGDEQHQRQQRHPHDDGRTEAALLVPPEDGAEEHEAQHAPYDKQEEGLPGEAAVGHQARQQEVHPEEEHEHQARNAVHALVCVPPDVGQAGGGHRHKGIDERGADCGHVHDPADGRPPQQGDQYRYGQHQPHGLTGKLPVIELGKAHGQDAIPGQGVEQPGEHRDIGDKAGAHQRQQRSHEDGNARGPHRPPGGVEGRESLDALQIAQVPDVGEPAVVALGIGRDGQEDHQNVQHRQRRHGENQDPADTRPVKRKLRRRVGNALKPDKSPGRDDGDLHDLRQGGRVRHRGRRHALPPAQKGRRRDDDDADGQHDHHDLHRDSGRALAAHTKEAHQHQGRHAQQRLPGVHIVPEDGVEPAELQHIPYKVPHKQRQGGGVGPEHGEVGQRQKPRHQEAVVIAEGLPCIGIGAAGFGEQPHEIGVVPRNDQHNDSADNKTQHTAQRPRLGQVAAAGDHQRAPAHAGPDGKGPRPQRVEIRR